MSAAPMLSQSAKERIAEAHEAVRLAEGVLERTLGALDLGDRADKKMIGEALRTAFESLKVARANLEALQVGGG